MLKGITIMTMVQMIGLLLRWRWYAPADDNYNYVSDGYDDYLTCLWVIIQTSKGTKLTTFLTIDC